MSKLKFIASCQDCKETRMKPYKAWAVVRDGHLQGQEVTCIDVLLVMSTKKRAKKYKCFAGDRVARVEIREIS